MISILLVDDHPSVREGTKAMIEEDSNFKVTLAATGDAAIQLINSSHFDIYIFDLFMPDISGIELTKIVMSKNSDAIILIITGFDVEPHVNVLLEAGVSGFISKTASKEQLQTTIKCALRKEAVIPVSLLKQLRRSEVYAIVKEGSPLLSISLNDKEIRVLIAASQGLTNKEIAKKLLMSQRMVEYHLTKIFKHLKVSSRGEAIAKARELKILPNDHLPTNE